MRNALRLSLIAGLLVALMALVPGVLAQEGTGTPCGDVVVVTEGDTLFSIARRCDTTVEALVQANPGIGEDRIIQVGQRLQMPQTAQPQPPLIAIHPLSGSPGTVVQAIVNGFPPRTDVIIGVGRAQSEFDVADRARTDADGALNTRVTIPDDADVDERWVVVVQTAEDADQQASVTSRIFHVEVDAAVFTSTNIYLTALNDNGQNGIPVGCGDSVVPVEVDIGPTVAPLTAALETMFAGDTRFYNQTNFYNALYLSDLTIDSIDIDNGEAIIELSGTISFNGTCDIPRIVAQIRQTALQYTTVDRVTVTVEGVPLDDLLAGQG